MKIWNFTQCYSMSRLNVNFMVSPTMMNHEQPLEPYGISTSICWFEYSIFGMFTLSISSLLSLKTSCALCFGSGSNSP